MKKLCSVCVGLLSIILFFAPVLAEESAVFSPLIINEIGAFEATNCEWVEIQNISSGPLDINNYTFFEDNTKHKLKAVTNDLVLNPNEFAVIVQDPDKFLEKHAGFSGTLIDSSWGSLKEEGEEIGLTDATGNFLEKFIYIAAAKTSLERKDAKAADYSAQNWLSHATNGTPGQMNDATKMVTGNGIAPVEATSTTPVVSTETTTDPVAPPLEDSPPASITTDTTEIAAASPPNTPVPENPLPQNPLTFTILINEVSFRDTRSDWVELYLQDSSINFADLGGYTLWGDNLLFTIPSSTILYTGNYYVAELQKTASLPATTEQLVLKNPQGQAVDAVCWTNGSIAEREWKDMQTLAGDGMWNSAEPTSCVNALSLGSNQTIGRRWAMPDSNSKNDWEILTHATKNMRNANINHDPVAAIAIQKGKLEDDAPLLLNLTGESSFDPDGDAIRFYWNFGDGSFDDSPNPKTHAFQKPGKYHVKLTVEDAYEATSEASLDVVAHAPHTEAEIATATASGLVSQTTTLALARSSDASEKKTAAKKKATTKTVAMKISSRRRLLADGRSVSLKPPAPKKLHMAAGKNRKRTTVSRPSNGNLSTEIHISEIFPRPPANSDADEWVELFNGGEKPVRLANWMLDDDEKGSKPYSLPTVTLEPHGYLVVTRKQSGIALNNDRDVVRLFDFQKKLMDSVTYEKADVGKSYALINEQWQWSPDTTPGAENPHYQKIEGLIEKVDPAEKIISIKAGEKLFTVLFEDSLLQPMIAPLALPKNAHVILQATENADGLLLRKIEAVDPPQVASSSHDDSSLLIALLVLAALAVNGVILLPSLWQKFRKKKSLF